MKHILAFPLRPAVRPDGKYRTGLQTNLEQRWREARQRRTPRERLLAASWNAPWRYPAGHGGDRPGDRTPQRLKRAVATDLSDPRNRARVAKHRQAIDAAERIDMANQSLES